MALDVATGLGAAARRARVLVSTDASRRLTETLGRQADLLRWEDDLVPAGAPMRSGHIWPDQYRHSALNWGNGPYEE